jgi:hypothetical protein
MSNAKDRQSTVAQRHVPSHLTDAPERIAWRNACCSVNTDLFLVSASGDSGENVWIFGARQKY